MGDSQKPQSIKVIIRKPNRPPPPPPGLPPGFHATAAASAFLTKKKPPPKSIVICCDSCYGFLVDYIRVVVSTQGLATGSQGKRIRRVAPQLAQALNLYFSSLVPLDIYVIENTVKLRFGIQTESLRLRGPILLTAVVNHNNRGKDLLTQMRVVLEDACIFMNEVEEDIWIGELLWDLWAQVITIHREHSKQIDPTSCGPPFGFRLPPQISEAAKQSCPSVQRTEGIRVHTPAPVNIHPAASSPPPTPTVVAAHAQQAWKPPEGSWSECDLYD